MFWSVQIAHEWFRLISQFPSCRSGQYWGWQLPTIQLLQWTCSLPPLSYWPLIEYFCSLNENVQKHSNNLAFYPCTESHRRLDLTLIFPLQYAICINEMRCWIEFWCFWNGFLLTKNLIPIRSKVSIQSKLEDGYMCETNFTNIDVLDFGNSAGHEFK